MVIYNAVDDPKNSPDGSGGVDVWTTNFSSNSSQLGSFLGADGWGLFANSGATAEARADVSSLLPASNRDLGVIGDMISLDLKNGLIDSGNGNAVGVAFLDDTDATQAEFLFFGGDTEYRVIDSSGTNGTEFGFTNQGLNLKLTILDGAGGFRFDISDSGNNKSYLGTFLGGDSTISTIRFFNFDAGSGSERDAFINNLQLTAVPEPVTALSFAIACVVVCRRRR